MTQDRDIVPWNSSDRGLHKNSGPCFLPNQQPVRRKTVFVYPEKDREHSIGQEYTKRRLLWIVYGWMKQKYSHSRS